VQRTPLTNVFRFYVRNIRTEILDVRILKRVQQQSSH